MLRSKRFYLSVLALMLSTSLLHAQTAVDSLSQVEARKVKYLSGLQKISSEKELRYADSVTTQKGVSEADVICLSQDFQKVHRFEFSRMMEQSDYHLTADTYVDAGSVIRVKVARPATKEEYDKAIEDFRKLVETKTPESIEREKIIASQMNKPAPLFSVWDVDSIRYDLSKLKGKVVVLNFWFIGCAPCRKEMPELNKLVEKYKAKDVVFLAFEVNDNPASKVKSITKGNFNYTMVPSRRDGIAAKYHVKTYPTSYVIDQNGVIRFGLAAYNPFKLPELDKTIETLLNH